MEKKTRWPTDRPDPPDVLGIGTGRPDATGMRLADRDPSGGEGTYPLPLGNLKTVLDDGKGVPRPRWEKLRIGASEPLKSGKNTKRH